MYSFLLSIVKFHVFYITWTTLDAFFAECILSRVAQMLPPYLVVLAQFTVNTHSQLFTSTKYHCLLPLLFLIGPCAFFNPVQFLSNYI